MTVVGRVSVIIPTFQRAHVVGRAVCSVLGQSYEDIEIIVIDDGSTDPTEETIQKMAAGTHRPVIYHRQTNAGCARARNVGLRMASGEFVSFLDSDDEWLPAAAERLVVALRQADADIAYAPTIEVDGRGREWINLPAAYGQPTRLAIDHFLTSNIRTGSYLVRRGLIDCCGGFDEDLRHNEDSDFFQRLAIGAKATSLSGPVARIHIHADGKSRDRVAVGRALLYSARHVLSTYPAFAASLGAAAGRRVAELEANLVAALILDGQLATAHEEVAEHGVRLQTAAAWALRLGHPAPLRAARWVSLAVRGLRNRVLGRSTG